MDSGGHMDEIRMLPPNGQALLEAFWVNGRYYHSLQVFPGALDHRIQVMIVFI
jgi:hypothetical protein